MNQENFNKVSPYSIKNLTSYKIKVVNGTSKLRSLDQFEDPFQLGSKNSVVGDDSFYASAKLLKLSLLINEGLELHPGQTIDYSVDLDKESNNMLAAAQSSKRL